MGNYFSSKQDTNKEEYDPFSSNTAKEKKPFFLLPLLSKINNKIKTARMRRQGFETF